MRKIPATLATQHPDNSFAPFWKKDHNPFVSTREEIDECLICFKDLGCEEYMWDWEGKFVDEAVIDRIFNDYYDYFNKNHLGKDRFLTFRIPNIWQEKGYTLCRAMMVMLTAENLAKDLQFNAPPLFEVILPMADSAEKLLYIQKTFTELAHFKNLIFNDSSSFNYIDVMPLIEGIENLFQTGRLLQDYVTLHEHEYKRKPDYIRVHIARSDPALNSGLIPAVIAAKVALSEIYRFGQSKGIPVYPALGVGTMPFRGGLSPLNPKQFLEEYSGVRTVYVQSAFRYDYPIEIVKESISYLNKNVPNSKERIMNWEEINECALISDVCTPYYKKTIEEISDTINAIAEFIPKRRERKLHIGLFGYSRSVGKKKLPRAIKLAASMYTLGVPIEFIGTGRALADLSKKGIDVTKYYLNLKSDLEWAGRFLNKENLEILAQEDSTWKEIKKDIQAIENYFEMDLGPIDLTDKDHQKLTSEILLRWQSGQDIIDHINICAMIRKTLG